MPILTKRNTAPTDANYLESGEGVVKVTKGSVSYEVSLLNAEMPVRLQADSTVEVISGWCAYSDADGGTSAGLPTTVAGPGTEVSGGHNYQSGSGAGILEIRNTSGDVLDRFYLKLNKISYPFDSTAEGSGETTYITAIGETSHVGYSG